jgi:phosphoglycerate dehydrogenase-like enzyme
MDQKVKILITVIPPSPPVRKVLSEIEHYADIVFLGESETIEKYVEEIEVLYGNIDEKNLAKARRLRWVQTNSTGVEQVMYPAFRNSDIILTNTGRSITTVVADHAVTMFLSLARNIHHQRDLMKEHKWEIVCGRDIGRMTLGILGYGKIGREIGVRVRTFVNKLYVLDILSIEASDIVDKTFNLDALHDFLGECDAVICSLPLSPSSMNLISDREFGYMKNDSYLINISRGEIVNQDALLRALRSKKLAGAGIDVLEKEPCPPESPLWEEPNLLLTPHSAGYCETLEVRKMEQFVENFRNYIKTGKIPMSLNKSQGW